MKFKNRITLKIKSLNQEEFFNKILSHKVKVFNLKRLDMETQFDIEPKDLKLVQATLKNNNIETLSQKESGFVAFKSSIVSRLGVFVALMVAMVLFLLSNLFVLQISVKGCNKLNQNAIVKFLQDRGYNHFSYKPNLDCDKIELEIMENFQQVSLVSVLCIGTSLVINIKEKQEDLTTQYQGDIISTFEGRIISMEVNSGIAKVSNGDLIREGDILVEGLEDSNGIKQQAKANIKAEVWIQNELVVPLEKIELEKTGKVQNFRTIEVFNKLLFSNITDCKFDNYLENVKSEVKIGSILPLKITNFKYEEVVEKVVSTDFEANKEYYIEECRQNALQKVQNNDIITEEKYFIENEVSFSRVNYLVIVERNIIWS